MEGALLIAVATMGGLGLLFAAALAIADRKLRVEENPLIAQANDLLPGANCGACGMAGCYDFAVKLVEGSVKVTGCPVGGEDTANDLAELLGVEAGSSVKMLPRIHCNGGNAEAVSKEVEYDGPLTCSAMHLISGGNKLCFYGCLGEGDCVRACPFDALVMNPNGLPEVLPDVCTGCGICAQTCPRHLIEMHPEDREFFVFCKNQDDAKTAKSICKVACIGCSLCARKSEGAIEMVNNLAVIDYDKLNPEIVPFEKCPTNAIGSFQKLVLGKVEEKEVKEEAKEEAAEG